MNRQLAQSNYHVAPGDILLLRGRGKGVMNRAGQALRRLRPTAFTHVAVVVDETRIVDAMPEVGVSFRGWRDVEHQYNVNQCRIARNEALAADPSGIRQVQRHATYYVKQPYRLHTALLPSGPIKDQRGLVCSHFVGALMDRVGLKVSRYAPSATLPVDIDRYTRARTGWRQFPLRASGLYSGAARPPQDDPYWAALRAAAAPEKLSDEQQAQAMAMADALTDAVRDGQDGALDAWFQQVDALIARGKSINERTGALLSDSIETQYGASRLSKDFEVRMLALCEGLARGSPEALRLSMELLKSDSLRAGPLEPMSGRSFLRQWQALYPDSFEEAPALFLHDEDRSSRLARHRDLFVKSVDGAQAATKKQLEMFESLQQTMNRYVTAAKSGLPNLQWMLLLRDAARSLLEGAWFIGDEPIEELSARIESIPDLQQGLLRFAQLPNVGRQEILQAGDVLHAIGILDLDQRFWRTAAEPCLRQYVGIIEEALAAEKSGPD